MISVFFVQLPNPYEVRRLMTCSSSLVGPGSSLFSRWEDWSVTPTLQIQRQMTEFFIFSFLFLFLVWHRQNVTKVKKPSLLTLNITSSLRGKAPIQA